MPPTPSLSLQALLQQARQAFAAGQPQAAQTHLLAALEQAPDYLPTYEQLAQLYLQCHQVQEAYQVTQVGLKQQPDHLGLQLLSVQTLLKAGAVQQASRYESALLTALDAAPLQVMPLLAELRRFQGRLPEAVTLMRQALQHSLTYAPTPAAPSTAAREDFGDRHQALLEKTLVQLAAAGVHAFTTSGTLLGLVRDGRLLPFDKDVDVGLPFAEMQAAIDCLTRQGWQEHLASYGLANPRCLRHSSGLILDLCGFVFEEASQRTLAGFWLPQAPWAWQRITEYPPLKLQRQNTPVGEIWAVQDPQAWLTALYGDGWITPDPDFNTVVAAKNLRGFSLLTEYYACLYLRQHWQKRQLNKVAALVNALHAHRADDALFLAVQQQLNQEGHKGHANE
ncbi:LicD family protein [Ectothiorhodospira magna]|uniref:LicD family protein n=1 Tax=Ectothiorhodospira magna TaxID=867345 RepID=A0A1H9BT51_9GAMM|nr:tetratricopeptide repeat protein [Ectothiorhodospira magna]SEP91881.1 LicD family protein [Ectothiorhodospira magna]